MFCHEGAWRPRRSRRAALVAVVLCAVLAACGGGGGDTGAGAANGGGSNVGGANGGGSNGGGSNGGGSNGGGSNGGGTPPTPMTALDANRLAHQASFGPSETLLTQMQTQSASQWIQAQMALKVSRYTSGNGDLIHTHGKPVFFCEQPESETGPNCWRDWFSTEPLEWDFFRNAVGNSDQLRQRVAWALSQWLVVSGNSIAGTYGFRNWHNMLLDQAFGNYRELLRRVTLSPVMGEYLNNVNNDREAPNENYARELLQLFSIGTCELNADGSLKGGTCRSTYDNNMVRNYAFALTGWTYPAGGRTSYGCFPSQANCQYWGSDMVPYPARRDSVARDLLNGFKVPANTSAAAALSIVLDSLMAHPNTAPYVGRQLIQHLVTSNPSPAYVGRVAQAFVSGRHASFGTGQRGDLAATVAAVLLDAEARSETPDKRFGRLREPVQVFTGAMRALNARTDGGVFGYWFGRPLQQHAFMPPSVFNYYPPDFPVTGTALVGPAFGIHNANTSFTRLNFLLALTHEWDLKNGSIPNASGTAVDYSAFRADIDDPAALVDRFSRLAYGRLLPAAARAKVIDAVEAVTADTAGADIWRQWRLRTAAYLVFAAPQYQIVR
jgi:uncharacterized protein (DUF1800 family)